MFSCLVLGFSSWHWQIALREGKTRMIARCAMFVGRGFLHTKMQKTIEETLTWMLPYDWIAKHLEKTYTLLILFQIFLQSCELLPSKADRHIPPGYLHSRLRLYRRNFAMVQQGLTYELLFDPGVRHYMEYWRHWTQRSLTKRTSRHLQRASIRTIRGTWQSL